VTDREALTDMRAEALDAGGIDVAYAARQARRLRHLQATGYPMTMAQLDVLAACERRVRLAETFATPKETTA
jgi:hypothetical protein